MAELSASAPAPQAGAYPPLFNPSVGRLSRGFPSLADVAAYELGWSTHSRGLPCPEGAVGPLTTGWMDREHAVLDRIDRTCPDR